MDDFDRYLQELDEQRREERRETFRGMVEAALAFWPALGLLILGFQIPPGALDFLASVVSHG